MILIGTYKCIYRFNLDLFTYNYSLCKSIKVHQVHQTTSTSGFINQLQNFNDGHWIIVILRFKSTLNQIKNLNEFKSICVQINKHTSDVLIVVCSTSVAAIVLVNFSKKKDNTKIHMKALNGYFPIEKHAPKWTKVFPRCSQHEDRQYTFFI